MIVFHIVKGEKGLCGVLVYVLRHVVHGIAGIELDSTFIGTSTLEYRTVLSIECVVSSD